PNSEVYLRLAELTQEVFANRRTAEWRLNFSFWGSIGVIDYFVLSSRAESLPSATPRSIWCAAGILFLLYLGFQVVIHRENKTTSAFRFYYMDRAIGAVTKRPSPLAPWWTFLRNSWFYILMPFTGALLGVSAWLVSSRLT